MEVFSFIFGICIGSFLNVLILRLPLNQSLLTRSTCPKCNHLIYWYHNIPLLSYIFLKTKCSYCRAKISFTYFLVELLSGIITLALFLKLGFTLDFVFMCLLSYVLITLSFIDLKYKAVPDYLLLIALVLSFFASNFSIIETFKNAFLFSGAFVLLNFVITFYIQNIKSRILKDENLKNQVALGEGDIPVIASMAVILGLNSLVYAILLSAIIAILHTISINIVKKDIQIPFIPSLVLGFFIEYFFNLEHFIKAF